MPSMNVSLELIHGQDFGAEVVLMIDFKVTSYGCPAHTGSLTYSGHPAEGPEIEIEKIFWPITRWDAEKKQHTPDHIEFPYEGLPADVAEGLESYIVEHYDTSESHPDE